MATSLRPIRTRAGRRSRALPALVAPAYFLLTVTLLSAADRGALSAWGWTPLDHHGVPWPSSLALLPGGWLQTVAFAGTGAALIALATALPRGGRAVALACCGAGLVAAAFPLDPPGGDPASPASWIHSWSAVVHAGGFAVAGVAALLAVGASRRRVDMGFAALLAVAAVLGGTPGWYGYLVGFLVWVTLLARRTVTPAGHYVDDGHRHADGDAS
jgi:hypothetical protein